MSDQSTETLKSEYGRVALVGRTQLRRVGLLMGAVIIFMAIGAIGGIYQLALFGALVAAIATLTASLKLRRLGRELSRLGSELDARRQIDAATEHDDNDTAGRDAGGSSGNATDN